MITQDTARRYSFTRTPLNESEYRLLDGPRPAWDTATAEYFGVFDRDRGRYVSLHTSRASAQAEARALNVLAVQKAAV